MSSLATLERDRKYVFMVIAVDTWDDGMQFSCFCMCHCIFLERGLPDLIGAWNLYFHRDTHTLDNEQESDFFSSDDRFLIFIYLFTFVKKEMHCIAQIRREIVNFVPLNISFHFTKKKKFFEQLMQFFIFILQQMKAKERRRFEPKKPKLRNVLCVWYKNL